MDGEENSKNGHLPELLILAIDIDPELQKKSILVCTLNR